MALFPRILAVMGICFAVVCGPGCTKLNLVEQLEPADRRVPIIKRYETDANGRNIKRVTLYELNGCYYVPLTVYMGKEDVPIFGLRWADMETRPGKSVRYTPDPATARVWFFPLSDEEASACLKELHPKKKDIEVKQPHDIDTAPIVAATQFDVKRARVCGKVKRFWPKSVQASQDASHCTTPRLPVDEGSRSLGYYVAYGPVWCLDAVGNVAIFATESALAIPGVVIFGGVLLIVLETFPHVM